MDGFTSSLHGLIRVADLMREGANDRSLRTAASAGTMIRLARGCYVRAVAWCELSPDQQYLLRIRAAAATRMTVGGVSGWPQRPHALLVRGHTAGESLSRVMIHRLRMPEPQLQVAVRDAEGRLHHTDFGWEHALGEFDGRFKYSRHQYTQGRPPEEVVWAEKLREDAIRHATGKPMVRWVWDHLQDLASFEKLLRAAGIHPVSER